MNKSIRKVKLISRNILAVVACYSRFKLLYIEPKIVHNIEPEIVHNIEPKIVHRGF